jgi:hypothetical protein
LNRLHIPVLTTSHLTEDTLTLDALKAGESAERPGGRLLQLGAGGGHQARVAGFRHSVRPLTPKKMFLIINVLWPYATLFVYFFFFLQYTHSYNHS